MAIVLHADRPVVRLWLLIRGVLVLYLNGIGLSESQTALLLTLTLIGDTLVSLCSQREQTAGYAAIYVYRVRP